MQELDFIEAFFRDNLEYIREKHRRRREIAVSSKRDANDVEQIHARFPGDTIVAEEGEFAVYEQDLQQRAWVMDPIDGTNNFVRGIFPLFAVSLAFAENGEAQAAGVLLPGTGETFLARRGGGATRNGALLRVSDVDRVDEARVEIDFSTIADRRALVEHAPELLFETGQIRCLGSAVLSITHVAAGEAEAYFHVTLNPWDYAAAQLLVEEAGGRASRLDGSPLRIFDKRLGVLISNGRLHEDLRRLVQGADQG
jgi:fructose-1,6-bisphosphatase/inositol monophosphatase family enzyme